MAPFHPIYVSRTDGKLATGEKGRNEPNEPTAEQLDNSPDSKGVCDYYRKLEPEDGKEIDWRRKLGGMLMREIGGKEYKGRSYILASLPENYRLYEHLKQAVAPGSGKLDKSGSSSAKMSSERQDAYLYGHPMGRKKRYRSPADFFPHLLWLCTDETGNPNNCACKVCAPEEVQDPKKRAEKQGLAVKREQAKQTAQVKRPQVPQTTSQNAVPPEKPKAPPKASHPQLPTPTPLAVPRRAEQELDSRYGEFLYRPGEVVWLKRGAGWALSALTMRSQIPDDRQQALRQYEVQPFGNPYSHKAPVLVSEPDLRPWLAWSTPKVSPLVGPLPKKFHEVDWLSYAQRATPGQDIDTDASILAAHSVDESYTPFDLIEDRSAKTGETYWNGLYIGGEKIWVGDIVRLSFVGVRNVMVLSSIVEKLQESFSNSRPSSSLTLVGDIYTLSTLFNQSQSPPEDFNVPPRMRADLRYHNQVTGAVSNTFAYWKLLTAGSRIGLSKVKGRWYESSVLLPVLQPEADYDSNVARGKVEDVNNWMNDRCREFPEDERVGVRKATRRIALGDAVPGTFQIKDLDTPQEQIHVSHPAEPQLPQAIPGPGPLSHQDVSQTGGDGMIDQFVDLENTDQDGMMQHFPGGGAPYY